MAPADGDCLGLVAIAGLHRDHGPDGIGIDRTVVEFHPEEVPQTLGRRAGPRRPEVPEQARLGFPVDDQQIKLTVGVEILDHGATTPGVLCDPGRFAGFFKPA